MWWFLLSFHIAVAQATRCNEKNGLQQFQMEGCQPIKRLKDKKKTCPGIWVFRDSPLQIEVMKHFKIFGEIVFGNLGLKHHFFNVTSANSFRRISYSSETEFQEIIRLYVAYSYRFRPAYCAIIRMSFENF
jgi:hypothetical protein